MRSIASSRLSRLSWRWLPNGSHTALCRRSHALRCGRSGREDRLFNPEAVVKAKDGSETVYQLPFLSALGVTIKERMAA